MTTHHPTALADIVSVIKDICKEAGTDERIRTGPSALYPNSLFIAILILKNLFGESSEDAFLRYLGKHHRDLFPRLPEQSWFNRKAKKLGEEERSIHDVLLQKLGAARIIIRIVDASGIPVVKLHKANRCKGFKRKTEASYGYCAAKKSYYYGEKLTISVTSGGIPDSSFILTPANVHDVRALKENLEVMADGLSGKVVVADKGYYDGDLESNLSEHHARLVVPEKRRHRRINTKRDKKLLKGRKIIETVFEQMQDHMNLDCTRAKSHKGLAARIRSILLSFVFGMYWNMLTGRDLLALKSIVT